MLSCLLAVTELEDELDVLGLGPGPHSQPPQLRENQSPANERAGFVFLPANREPRSCGHSQTAFHCTGAYTLRPGQYWKENL